MRISFLWETMTTHVKSLRRWTVKQFFLRFGVHKCFNSREIQNFKMLHAVGHRLSKPFFLRMLESGSQKSASTSFLYIFFPFHSTLFSPHLLRLKLPPCLKDNFPIFTSKENVLKITSFHI